MTVKRWLFVDYENIPTLEYLEPKRYERLIVFIGPTQHSIKLPRAGQHGLMTLQVVQIRNQGKNSLDFHLAYYLGLLEAEAASSVEFEVLSLDKGFAPLIEYISAGGRVCRQLKMPQPGGPKKGSSEQ